MLKNMMIIISLVTVFAIGFFYVINSAPEQVEHQLVEQTIKTFLSQANSLETEFQMKGQLTVNITQLPLQQLSNDDSQPTDPLVMNIQADSVTLVFPAMNNALSQQSIILEPFINAQKVSWKCIQGTVLLRFRSKNCRLGKGVVRSD